MLTQNKPDLTTQETSLIRMFSICRKTTQKALMKIIRIAETTPDPDEAKPKIQAVWDALKKPTRDELVAVWTEARKVLETSSN